MYAMPWNILCPPACLSVYLSVSLSPYSPLFRLYLPFFTDLYQMVIAVVIVTGVEC